MLCSVFTGSQIFVMSETLEENEVAKCCKLLVSLVSYDFSHAKLFEISRIRSSLFRSLLFPSSRFQLSLQHDGSSQVGMSKVKGVLLIHSILK